MPKGKLLILDLDETLIYSSDKKLGREEDFKLENHFVYFRPELNWFLTEANNHFEIGIWSVADEEYVEKIVKRILPQEIKLSLLWSKFWSDEIIQNNGKVVYKKDLKKLISLGHELADLILVDDSEMNCNLNPENSILVQSWKGTKDDAELIRVMEELMKRK